MDKYISPEIEVIIFSDVAMGTDEDIWTSAQDINDGPIVGQ